MSDSTSTPADPIGSAAPDATQTPPPADPATLAPPTGDVSTPPAAVTAPDDDSDVQVQLDELRVLVGKLSAELAARPPATSPVAPITSTAPAGGPAAAAVAPGVPAHAMSSSLDDVDAGDVVRFAGIQPANGGDPISGYGLVLDVVDVDDETGGTAQGNRASHPELVVARLDVMGVRLRADQVVDEQASARVQSQLDSSGQG